MKKLNRGQKRRFHNLVSNIIGLSIVLSLIVSGLAGNTQTILAEAGTTVYLNGASGDDTAGGGTAETAVKTWKKAKSLAGSSGTIYISGTVTISGTAEWSLPSGVSLKRAPGFTKPLVNVGKGSKLTLAANYFGKEDASLGDDGCLAVKGEEKADSTPKKEEAQKKNESKKEPLKEDKEQEKQETEKKETEDKKTDDNKNTDDDKNIEKEDGGKSKPAKDISLPDSFTMEKPEALANLSLKSCSGDGTFSWADSSFVPDTYESACVVIFSPSDKEKYDYSQIKGWDEKKGVVKRTVTVYTASLKDTGKDTEKTESDTGKTETDEKTENSGGTQGSEPGTDKTPDQETQDKDKAENPGGVPEKNDTQSQDKQPGTDSSKGQDTPQGSDSPDKDPVQDKESSDEIGADNEETLKGEETEKTVASHKGSAFHLAVESLPVRITEQSQVGRVVAASKLYEELSPADKAMTAADDLKKLKDAQEAAGYVNRTSNGVSVSGDFLPWYVQFQVNLNHDAPSLAIPTIDTLLSSYEMKLWDLMTDTEYEIPHGRKVTVVMKAPEVSGYESFTIVHYLEDGTVELITPVIADGLMTFETSSFSPFDVGGSKPLVGLPSGDSSDKKTNSTGSSNNNSSLTGNNGSSTDSSNKTGTNKKKTPTAKAAAAKTQQTKASNPSTGDTSVLLPYIIGGAAALLIIIILVVTRKKKKK
ncbi:LPXTG cell wall anchor domain-containing protein [Lactonifactor sp. BIOML-A3]|uniref:LPXTG cell wall anchor domain-containing protein n=1 Tax=unclassified Lactonifactor TaxID=2636670 RepID=UPI0012B0AB3E|nr:MULTISPECIES: LPXTG cell wall anchor domain-containing protein [unclassified Lactonifactor]MSA02314.1 LPXTG cell wall anchor domain-containing protein [Lactonifactor sp. BIOML-A5]MSA08567.1 LPXTG cell wall anchor domain-containing protein [Lactonifactor sp. BIOML-A4]MSA14913.1 LPXTG cell wall anchor domain-containing protein [Lactonifactor sp. BIOML-A3]MSA16968.1 LPXTG cell wall anchor domain-containing protein [Lactonifactor sp. BIOML-A2]MSA38207.1 LPXTG cell wall anchor domain-containing 